jgi:mannosyltransferase
LTPVISTVARSRALKRVDVRQASWAGVAVLTLAAFALRVIGMDQSLYGDEMFTFVDTEHGLPELFDRVVDAETTPPLYFVLAWLSAQLGDNTVLIRLPSLVMGTAAVPLVYLLGLHTVGRRAALLGSALMAISPFAILYSTEARAYATLISLAALSTLALVRALEGGRRGWWIAYVLSSCLVFYTHYTGVFLLVAQAAWAAWAHRQRLRDLLLANAAVAIALMPWLPAYLEQRRLALGFEYLAQSALPVEPGSLARGAVIALSGLPSVPLRELPGRPALALLGIVLAAALVSAGAPLARRRAAFDRRALSSPVALLALIAVATPVAVFLYSAVSTNILVPRSFSASLPAAVLVIGWLVSSMRRQAALVGTTVLLAALAVGAVRTLDDDFRRPPFRDAARFIDARAGPGDPVIQFAPPGTVLSRQLSIYFDSPHDVFSATFTDDRAWKRGAEGHRVFLVVPQVGLLRGIPRRSGPDKRFPLRDYRLYPGWTPIGVFEYWLDRSH